MPSRIRTGIAGAAFLAAMLAGAAALAEPQRGGTLRVYHRENPASASMHEEASIATVMPFMAVFNNLVVYNQQAERNDPDDLTAELATEWRWSEDHRRLTFRLREGVTWHDGKPFTSADVKCTWDTIAGRRNAGWRKNPRRDWYANLQAVETSGDFEVSFLLGRPQPSFMAFLASGMSPVYPCHVDGRTMRQKPIGTGPFRVVEFRPNNSIELAATRPTGGRAGPTWTPSPTASSATARHASWPSPPANSTSPSRATSPRRCCATWPGRRRARSASSTARTSPARS